jgi:drug/metabolite transporter (DMT)-like permease
VKIDNMTAGIAYALGAMLCFGLGDLLYKRGAAAGVQAHQFLMVQTWVFMPTVLLYGLATGSLSFVAGSLWGALAGFFVYVGFYNFAHSLKHGSISVNAPIFRLSFVITAALAVLLLAEPLTFYKSAGIALALAAVWLLLGAPAAEASAARRNSRSSLARVLIATAAVGVGNFIYKLGLGAGATPASLVVAQAAVVIVLATGVAAALDGGIRPAAVAFRHAPFAAVALAFAFAFMVESLGRGQASVVVPIAQMGFIVTALLGFTLMRERFTARKGVGLIAALAALASLAHG